MASISLSNGTKVKIDKEDSSLLRFHHWHAIPRYSTTYAATTINGMTTYMHRLLLDYFGEKQVDHINGDGLDNRKGNLRLVTPTEQAANTKGRPKRAKIHSEYKGVSWHDTKTGGCWRAEVEHKTNGKRKRFILYASTEREAALLYNKLALEHFGVFAKVNYVSKPT